MTVPYCTRTDVRDAARLNISTTDFEAGITQMINTVSLKLDEYHNMPSGGFAVSVDTTRHYGYDAIVRGRLYLDVPCLSVTTLTNGDTVVIPSNGYRLHPRNEPRKHYIELLSSYGYTWGFYDDGEISVLGKFGYSTSVPDHIAEACAMWAGYLLKRYQGALQDATANQELGQLIYSEAIPKQVLALLRSRGPSL